MIIVALYRITKRKMKSICSLTDKTGKTVLAFTSTGIVLSLKKEGTQLQHE